MSLASGTKLGPYEILDPIGAGGMGEVYRGKDTRLDRVVAIKVLPAHVAANPEARQRFEREAKAVSSLNHPHICQLYDIGEQDGIDYLVMEYLEGETLGARLAGGAMPVALVLEHGIQIADALAQAHKQGVFHRDLKPGNIMLTASGAKLLDFGLAKLAQAAPAGMSAAAMPTRSLGLTVAGTILGTIQYMAPEQIEGKESDGRGDIFAFGAILYEMATGQKAFQGASPASVMAAILRAEPPPLTTLEPMSPPALDHLVRSCLVKDPNARRQNAHDLMLELKWIAEGGSQAGIPAPVVAERRGRERRWKAATAALTLVSTAAIAALVWVGGWLRTPPPEVGPVRFLVPLPEGTNLGPAPALPQAAISPDGRQLAFAAVDTSGKSSLWVRPLNSVSAQRLDRTDGAGVPFWSPDSQFIAFFADGRLKKVPVSGGAPQTLCEAKSFEGGTWSRDGTILFSPGGTEPLYRVAAAGGVATPATQLDKGQGEVAHRWPQFLPDGRRFQYLALSQQAGKSGIYVQSLNSAGRTRVLDTVIRAAYSPTGHLLFVREGTLMAQQVDGKLAQTGEPVRVAEEVTAAGGRGAFSVSDNGVLVYRSGRGLVSTYLTWYSRDGKRLGAVGEAAPYRQFQLSPDEKRVVFERVEGTSDLWLIELGSGIFSRLTFDPGSEVDAVWSPDSRRIVFLRNWGGKPELAELTLGSGEPKKVLEEGVGYPEDWTPDGRHALYVNASGKSLFRFPLEGERKPEVLLETPFDKDEFRLSPDGRWIAYNSLESGRWEVYAASYPSFSGKRQVSSAGGCQARWRKDGKELFYLALDGKLMAVPVTAGAALEAGVPKPLFQTTVSLNPTWDQYAVTGDGQRFLLNENPKTTAEQINVVIDWAAGLGR